MVAFNRLKAVLFDLDDTLIRHTWPYSQITGKLFEKFAPALYPLSAEAFFQVFWTKNLDLWYMMIDGVIDGDTAQLYSYINTLRALKQDISLGAEMMDYWEELVLNEAVLFGDALPVLAQLRPRFTTGIITNGFNRMQKAKLQRYHLLEAVDFCLVSEEAGVHKPDKRIFELALRKAGHILAEEAIFVGDNPVNDIEGALGAGIQPVLLDPEDQLDAPPGVIKINQLTDLLTLLPLRATTDAD